MVIIRSGHQKPTISSWSASRSLNRLRASTCEPVNWLSLSNSIHTLLPTRDCGVLTGPHAVKPHQFNAIVKIWMHHMQHERINTHGKQVNHRKYWLSKHAPSPLNQISQTEDMHIHSQRIRTQILYCLNCQHRAQCEIFEHKDDWDISFD